MNQAGHLKHRAVHAMKKHRQSGRAGHLDDARDLVVPLGIGNFELRKTQRGNLARRETPPACRLS